MSLVLLIGGVTPALGQAPSAESVEQGVTPMDKIDMGIPYPGQLVFPAIAPPEVKSPFILDSTFSAHLRTFYFNRDKYDNSRSEAWAIGGWIGFQSGYLADLFRVGAVAYTSQPLYAPDDRDGTLAFGGLLGLRAVLGAQRYSGVDESSMIDRSHVLSMLLLAAFLLCGCATRPVNPPITQTEPGGSDQSTGAQ